MKYLANLIVFLSIGDFNCFFVKSRVKRQISLSSTCKRFNDIPSDKYTMKLVTKRFIRLPVDHFDKKNNRTWHMKYMGNAMFFRPSSPIYILVGGQEALEESFLMEGFIYDLAKATNGAMFATEHRYYGQSHTDDDILYLHSKQAITDLILLIIRIKSVKSYKQSKVVLLGNAYGGNLAVWTKLKHPNMVTAVIASSAPVLARMDAKPVVLKVIEVITKYAHQTCIDRIKVVFHDYAECLKNGSVIDVVHKAGVSCRQANMKKLENKQIFFLNEGSYLLQAVQDGLLRLNSACRQFQMKHRDCNKNSTETKDKLSVDSEATCSYCDFDLSLSLLREYIAKDVRFRYYQMCNEFGHFTSTSFFPDPYSKMVPLSFFHKVCALLFGCQYDDAFIRKRIEETNKSYGGLNPKVNKVVFAHGELDPWSCLGVKKNPNNNTKVVVIPGESQSTLLKPAEENDSKNLLKVRLEVKCIIKKWISE